MDNISESTARRQRKAAGTANPTGAPVALNDAKRVLVILDASTRAAAKEAGGGNVSAGIRIMAEYFQKSKNIACLTD